MQERSDITIFWKLSSELKEVLKNTWRLAAFEGRNVMFSSCFLLNSTKQQRVQEPEVLKLLDIPEQDPPPFQIDK